MIGLAFRAGKTLTGSAACEKGLKQRRVKLLLMQDGLSPASARSFLELAQRMGTKTLTLGAQDRLGEAIGRPGIMVLGVTDKGFADAIRNNLDGGSGRI